MNMTNFESWRQSCLGMLQTPCQRVQSGSGSRMFPTIFSPTNSTELTATDKANPMPTKEEVEDWSNHVETEEEFQRRLKVERWGATLLANSSMIRFMVKHLAVLGCNPLDELEDQPNAAPKIAVGPCPPTIAGGFSPAGPGQPAGESGILICSNRIINKKHLEDTLAHEMVHWYDHCRFKMDWTDLRQHACSEVRAASLSGDCRWGREMRRMNFGVVKQHQECARRRAVLSIMGNPACKDEEHAKQVVDDVFQSCFNDTRPFDDVRPSYALP